MAKFTEIIGKKPVLGSEESIASFKSATEKSNELNGGQGGCGGDEEFFAKIPAPDLEVQIDSFTMKSPLATAAGCYGYGIEYKDYQKLSELGAVFSIGTTLEPCYGAAQPRMLEGSANVLTNTALDPIAKIPELKVCAARIEKA